MKRFLIFSLLVAPMVLFGAEERRGPRPGPGPRPIPLTGPGGGHGPGHGPGFPGGPGHGPGFPGQPGHGQGSVLAAQTAQQLIANLDQLSSRAEQRANIAYNNRNIPLYNDLRDISYNSSRLSQEVRQGVLRPLRMNQNLFVVRQNLNGMRFDFQRLNRSVNQLHLAPLIKREMDEVENSLQQLTVQLNGVFPGPQPGPHPGPFPGPFPGPGPLPGPTQFKCEAKDRGWEEHIFRPHVGYGRTQRQAEYAALRVCQQEHGNCVISRCEVVR